MRRIFGQHQGGFQRV